MDISWILRKRYPEASWSLLGDDYQDLIWRGPGEKPSYNVLKGHWLEVQAEVLNEKAAKKRQLAYEKESDPIFFDWQRGEATKEDWLEKISEIKARHPYSGNSQT